MARLAGRGEGICQEASGEDQMGPGCEDRGDRAEATSAEALPGDGSGSGAGATEWGKLGCKPRRT